jgi:hypothetical protein
MDFRGLTIFLLTVMLGGAAAAQAQFHRPRSERDDLQITKLFCAIRDGKLITFFEFKVQVVTDHPILTGEISNYQVQLNGARKYISGLLFTNINASNGRILGDTGDPDDIIGHFSLTRLDPTYAGRWAYEFHRSEYEVVRAVFNCSYNDTPPSERRRKWPR